MDTKSFFHKQVKTYQSIFPQFRLWLAQNKRITIDMVLEDMQKNPDKKHEWAFEYLCYSIPVDTLLENNIYPLNNQCKTSSVVIMDLTLDTILRTQHIISWDWGYLTLHKKITIDDILNHPELPWVATQIPNNPNFSYTYYMLIKEKYPHLIQNINYIFSVLSQKAIYQQIMECPDQQWTTAALRSPNITKEDTVKLIAYFTEKYPDHSTPEQLAWNTCENPNLSFDDIYELFGECAFRFAYACHNFTYQDFLKYPLEKWNVSSLNLKLPLHFILDHPNHQWHWFSILVHSTELTYDAMNNLPEYLIQELKKLWKMDQPDIPITVPFEQRVKGIFFQNEKMDPNDRKRIMEELFAYYREHPPTSLTNNMYYIYLITSNLFLEPSDEEIRKYFAKKKIIRILTDVHANPSYKQCRKRLFREFEELPCKKIRY